MSHFGMREDWSCRDSMKLASTKCWEMTQKGISCESTAKVTKIKKRPILAIELSSCGTMLLVLASLLAFASLANAAEPSSPTGQSAFPLPLAEYRDEQMNSAISQLIHRVQLEPFNLIATLIFFCAIVHTFLTPTFTKIARRYEREFDALEVHELDSEIGKDVARRRDKLQFRAQLSSFLGEVEAVFGVWLIPLFLGIIIAQGWPALVTYSASISPA